MGYGLCVGCVIVWVWGLGYTLFIYPIYISNYISIYIYTYNCPHNHITIYLYVSISCRDATLSKEAPAIKRALEQLIFKMKHLVSTSNKSHKKRGNDVANVYVGNLKHRRLDGSVISKNEEDYENRPQESDDPDEDDSGSDSGDSGEEEEGSGDDGAECEYDNKMQTKIEVEGGARARGRVRVEDKVTTTVPMAVLSESESESEEEFDGGLGLGLVSASSNTQQKVVQQHAQQVVDAYYSQSSADSESGSGVGVEVGFDHDG